MWLNPQFPADLVTFTEEILNATIHFLCSADTVSKVAQSTDKGLLRKSISMMNEMAAGPLGLVWIVKTAREVEVGMITD